MNQKKNIKYSQILPESECFVIKHPLKNALSPQNLLSTSESLTDTVEIDTEDYLLDLLLKDKIIYGKMISNSWLKNPFVEKSEPFGNEIGNLFLFQNDYHLIKAAFIEDIYKKEFFNYFEEIFLKIRTDEDKVLNSYHKYRLKSVNNVIEGFSIFIIWLSKYLKSIYLSFFLEFILIFLIYCFEKNQSIAKLKEYIINNILALNDSESIGTETEKIYFKLLGYSKPLYISKNEIIKFFLDYLIGNDILSK